MVIARRFLLDPLRPPSIAIGSAQTVVGIWPAPPASCFFLLKQFEDVLIYLTSIKTYFPQDEEFLWNMGIAQVRSESGDPDKSIPPPNP